MNRHQGRSIAQSRARGPSPDCRDSGEEVRHWTGKTLTRNIKAQGTIATKEALPPNPAEPRCNMTIEKTIDPAALTKLPDSPPKEPDEVTAFLHFYDRGSNTHLAVHLGNRDTTLLTGDCRVMISSDDTSEARRPDVLIAFGVNPQAFRARGHYVISEQGKPPTSSWRSPRRAPARWTPAPSVWSMLPWASPSTGVSTIRANITGANLPETGWLGTATSPSTSTSSLTGGTKATAQS